MRSVLFLLLQILIRQRLGEIVPLCILDIGRFYRLLFAAVFHVLCDQFRINALGNVRDYLQRG